mgnify:FL=1
MRTIDLPKIIQVTSHLNCYKAKDKLSKEEKFTVKIMTIWLKEEIKKINF